MKKILYKTDQNNPTIKAYKDAIEKGKNDKHVLPRENGWVVKSLSSHKASSIFSTQAEAAKHARSVARSEGTAVIIHGPDGRIRDRDSYRNDPNPPRDRKH